MFASFAVGPARDIQPILTTLVGTCASATDGASTVPKTTVRKKVTCLGFMITSLRCLSKRPNEKSSSEKPSNPACQSTLGQVRLQIHRACEAVREIKP